MQVTEATCTHVKE